jgi:hypothetical protein
VRFSGCAQADDESVNETVDEEGEEEEEWAPAGITLKDLVEAKPFAAAVAKGGGSVGESPRPVALQLSPLPAVPHAALHWALILNLGVDSYRR